MAHAEKSPSSGDRWMVCHGSVNACRGLPDTDSEASREGTAAHAMAEGILTETTSAVQLLGKHHANGVAYTYEMAQHVSKYTNRVFMTVQNIEGRKDKLKAKPRKLFVEVQLAIGHITGEEGAHGTADAIILGDREMWVRDLKFGRGHVVEAENNRQLRIYALAALDEFDLTHGPFDVVHIGVDMPRLGGLSEWSVSVEDLEEFRAEVMAAAKACDEPDAPRTPDEKACRYCKFKTQCPELAAVVRDTVAIPAATAEGEELGRAMAMVPLVQGWCKAIEQATGNALRSGATVPGFKLVQGQGGHRYLTDADAAISICKRARLKPDEYLKSSLVGVPALVSLCEAGRIGPRLAKDLAALISRPEGAPVVVPEKDKRPAVQVLKTAQESDFDDLTGAPAAADADSDFEDLTA